MAITRKPGGFVPYGPILRTTVYRKSSATVIGQGDWLVWDGAGLVEPPINGITGVKAKTIGVAANFVTSTAGERTVHVYDHPEQLFKVQCSDAINYADLGLFYALTYCKAGTNLHCNRTLGLSGHFLTVTNATASFRVMGVVSEAGGANTTGTANQWVWGQISSRAHIYSGSTQV